MKGFVLAAGFGKRLSPVTDIYPKPLLPVGNLPLIGYALKFLAYHEIRDVIVNVHHLADLLMETIGDGSAYGVHITWSREEEILGTGGGLKKMHQALQEDTCVVVNSDTIIDVDLHALVAKHRANGALASLVLRSDPASEEYGQLEIDGQGKIRKILGQGENAEGLKPFMFAGVHVIEPRLLEYIPPDVNTCIMRYAYTKALQNHEPLYGVVMDGYWADAGTPKRYFQANTDALRQNMVLRHVDPLAGFEHEPKHEGVDVVRMGKDVVLGDAVDIIPPVLLGDGTRVGDHAVIGPLAVIGPKVQIGKGAQISYSVILAGSHIQANSRKKQLLVTKKAKLALDR